MKNKKNDLDTKRSRREFMKAAGKLALWIPPALVVLSTPKESFGAQSWNSGQGNLDHPGDGNGGPSNSPPGLG